MCFNYKIHETRNVVENITTTLLSKRSYASDNWRHNTYLLFKGHYFPLQSFSLCDILYQMYKATSFNKMKSKGKRKKTSNKACSDNL